MTSQEKEALKAIPKEYRPMGAWKLFWYYVLFCIPLIGTISLFVCAFGAKNIQLRSYARFFFIVIVAMMVVSFLVGVLISVLTGLGIVEIVEIVENVAF